MLHTATMAGDTPDPVSYYNSRTGELKGLPHPTQSYSLYNGAETNGVPQSGRPPLRSSHYMHSTDSPVSPRTHQSDPSAPWAHQRPSLDHRVPPIAHRDISHSSPGIPSPDCRPLHSPASFARPSNAIHPGHAPQPAPLPRERETFEMRPFVSADRMLQHPLVLQPPIPAEHQLPPHHQDYGYSSGPTPGGEFARPYPPPFDSRAQHTNHLERRHTAPHQLGVSMYSEPRRESHTPSGSSTTTMSPQDYVRTPGGQSSNYTSTSDPRHQNYRLHHSTTEVSHQLHHNDLIHSPLHSNMGSRQHDFSPQQHGTASTLEPSGMSRVMNQKYSAPSQSTAILATKQVTSEGFEPPSKRVKTEEHGSTGQSTGDVSDQDTEDEDMYGAEDGAGSGTPDPKKRKYSGKSSSRPPMRGTTRINPEDLGDDQLPAYVDGVRVNKEWGLTKAGKARQRLPQACIACRKKKIKCIIVKGQTICDKCKQQNMACEFKQSTSSRSKGNSAVPENETSHDRNLEDYHTSETPSTYAREDAEMSGIAELKREGENDIHGMDDIPAIEPTKEPTSLRQEEEIPHTIISQPAPMFVPDVMKADLSAASRISEDSQLSESTRQAHVREMAAQLQGGMRPRQNSVGSVVAGTPGLGSSPPSPVSTEVCTPRRYYHSVRSRSTPIASTPTIPPIPGPMGEDPRDPLLPEPKALEHLCTLYFTHLYSQHYPFLHRGTFMANLEKHCPVLLFSLCAIAARFSPHYRDKEEEFAIQARQRILDSFDVQKLEVVQAMVLMGLHDFGSNNGHKAWMFAGMAVRLGSALNLNMEPRKEKALSPIETEVHRRTYWSYYLMDRLNSYGVARPFLTQDHDCHIQLPCDQDSFENGRAVFTEYLGGKNPCFPDVGNKNMGAFAYLVRITSIWGDVLKYIHLSGLVTHDTKEKLPKFKPDAKFTGFVDRLKEWKGSLPKSLRYSEENLAEQTKAGTVGTYIMMHVMFHTCATYVYRYVMTVRMPESSKEFITQHIPKEYIVDCIRKIYVHANSVMQIMEHVWQRKEEAERNEGQYVTVVAPFIGHAVSEACLICIIVTSKAFAGVATAEAQTKRVSVAITWLRELKKYWKPIEPMYDKLIRTCRYFEKIHKPAKSALPESSSSTGSASVSPKQGRPLDRNFIPSPDSASQQIQMMHQNLVPYQQGSPLQFAYENAPYASDMLQTMQYTHLSDLVYNVPYLYYVDAFSGQGAMSQLAEYAMDLDLFYPDLVSSSIPLGTQPLRPLGVDPAVGLDHQQQQQQQQQQQNPMTTLNSSILTHSPPLSSPSTHGHSHNAYLDHRTNRNEVSLPTQSPAASSPQQATDSGEEGEDDGDDGEDDNQEEKSEKFGHTYFETRNRMEILHCLNSESVKDEVREAVEAPSKNILESDGEADGEKEHCTSGVSDGAVVLEKGESSNST